SKRDWSSDVCSSDLIQLILPDKFLEFLDMCGAAVGIDVGSVRLIVDYKRLGAYCVKDTLGDGGSASVRTVQSYTFSLERTGRKGDQMADIAVAACGKVYRAADILSRRKRNFRGRKSTRLNSSHAS